MDTSVLQPTSRTLLSLMVVLVAFGASSAKGGALPSVVVSGGDPVFAPYAMMDGTGKITGANVDLNAAIAKRIGVAIREEGLAWESVIPSLLAGHVDMVSMVITPQRKKVVDFTVPYSQGHVIMVVRAGLVDDLPTAATLGKFRIAGQLNSFSSSLIPKIAPGARPQLFPSVTYAYAELLLGRVDVVVIEDANGAYVAKTVYPGQLRLLDESLGEGGFAAFAVRKNEPQLRQALDVAITSLLKDGTIAAIWERWFGDSRMILRP